MDQDNNGTEEYRKYLKAVAEDKPYVVPEKWWGHVVHVTEPDITDTFKAAVVRLPPEGSDAYNELVNSKSNMGALLHPKLSVKAKRLWGVLTPRLLSLPPSWAYQQYETDYDGPLITADKMTDPKGDAKHAGYIRAFEIVLPYLTPLQDSTVERLPNDYELAKVMYRAASTGLATANQAILREQRKEITPAEEDEENYFRRMAGKPPRDHKEYIVIGVDLDSTPVGWEDGGEFHELISSDSPTVGTKEIFDDFIKDNPKQAELLIVLEEFTKKYPGSYTRAFLVKYLSSYLGLKADTLRKRLDRLIPPDEY